jgi:hypothetical protein
MKGKLDKWPLTTHQVLRLLLAQPGVGPKPNTAKLDLGCE